MGKWWIQTPLGQQGAESVITMAVQWSRMETALKVTILLPKKQEKYFPFPCRCHRLLFSSSISHLVWGSYSSHGRYRLAHHNDNTAETRLHIRGPSTRCTAAGSSHRRGNKTVQDAPCRSWWRSPGRPGGPWNDTGLLVWPHCRAPTVGCRGLRPS